MARLDVSARGLWGPMEKAFFDVRIFHPNATSNRSKTLPQLYQAHENEKKRTYNQRIIEVEHASFTPLVFSTSGGESPECLVPLQAGLPPSSLCVGKKVMLRLLLTSEERSGFVSLELL